MLETEANNPVESLQRRLEQSTPRILVIGDVILDHFVYGNTRRISPEAPVPIVEADDERFFAGGAANVMANLSGLGADVAGLAVVGEDPDSVRVQELLKSTGVDIEEFIGQRAWRTPRKCRVVAALQHVLRIDFEQKCQPDPTTIGSLQWSAERLIPDCDMVILSDYSKGTLTSPFIQFVIATARSHNRLVIVDPKGSDPARYASASVLTPNAAETEMMTGVQIHDEGTLEQAVASLQEKTGAGWIVVTRGEHGIAISGDPLLKLPAKTVVSRDVSGAGDTVVAALAFGLASGASIFDAARIANATAACVVARPGIATATRTEMLAAAADIDAASLRSSATMHQ